MNVQISGHHLEVTDSLKSYINEKLERIKRHHLEEITSLRFILSIENHEQKAEVLARVKGGEVVAHQNSDDMYAAIDGLTDKLDRQIIKHKSKSNKH